MSEPKEVYSVFKWDMAGRYQVEARKIPEQDWTEMGGFEHESDARAHANYLVVGKDYYAATVLDYGEGR